MRLVIFDGDELEFDPFYEATPILKIRNAFVDSVIPKDLMQIIVRDVNKEDPGSDGTSYIWDLLAGESYFFDSKLIPDMINQVISL